VGKTEVVSANLSAEQRAAILDLGFHGAGGEFDTRVMSDLMTMGYVEVESQTRKVVLTPAGLAIYAELSQRLPG